MRSFIVQGDTATLDLLLKTVTAQNPKIKIIHSGISFGYMPVPQPKLQLLGQQQQPQMMPCSVVLIWYVLPGDAEIDLNAVGLGVQQAVNAALKNPE